MYMYGLYVYRNCMYMIYTCVHIVCTWYIHVFQCFLPGISGCSGTTWCLLSYTVIPKFCGVKTLSTAKESHSLPMRASRQCGNGYLTALPLLWRTPP